jgi:DNA polymerase-1
MVMKTVYFDFEYRDNKARDCIILCSTKIGVQKSNAWDIRSEEGLISFNEFFKEHSEDVWAAYNADADLQCLISLGLDVSHLLVVDLMAEATMVMRNHNRYFSHQSSLLAALDTFRIESPVSPEYKDICRDIILGHTEYSELEWAEIVKYGLSDVDLLPELWRAIRDVHKTSQSYADLEEYFESALSRGEYVKSASILYRRSRGLPVNGKLLNTLFENREALRNSLCQKVNDTVGQIYRWDKPKKAFVLNIKALDALLSNDIGIDIVRTETGQLSIAELDTMIKGHPRFDIIYSTYSTLKSLQSTDLRELNKNGYIKAGYRTFIQDTGRTSPKPKEGFLLNLSPWMRSLIHPHKGEVLIAADWSQQEIYIGAVLSKDKKLLEAYKSGDIYIHLAKMAGAVPPDATKKSHPIERQNFKAVQLGIGYGKGTSSLALDIYNGNTKNGIPGLTLQEAETVAKRIMAWHKREFYIYWDWVQKLIHTSKHRRFYKTVDGSWVRFCDYKTKDTQLKNLPMQSNGAVLLRETVKLIAQEGSLDMVCSLHDAVYILSTEEKAEVDKNLLVSLMNKACFNVFGEDSRFYNDEITLVNIETKIFTHNTGYVDERGTEMFKTIMGLLDNIKSEKMS